jgi:hypothetical protein
LRVCRFRYSGLYMIGTDSPHRRKPGQVADTRFAARATRRARGNRPAGPITTQP